MKNEKGNVVQGRSDLKIEVRDRFGVLPNFFQLAPDDPQITANLWGFARFGYLDNPLPSLFKERLFVYLSRFCDVRYCIVRHVGFLLGLGRPAGDAKSRVNTIEEVIRLVQRPFPRGQELDRHLKLCAACVTPLAELPQSDSELERALFACAAHVFLQTADAPRCLTGLKYAFGASFEHLNVLLAFVRTAHYWTKIHPELELEEDIKALLATQQLLAECLLNDREARRSEISPQILDEVLALREANRNYESLSQDHEDLLHAHQVLRERERGQEALVEEQRRIYEKALSNTPDLHYVLDLKGRFRFINRPFLELLGREPAEVLGKTFTDLGYPALLVDRLNLQFERVIATGRQVRDETPLEFHDDIRHYEYILGPVFGVDGTVEAIVGATRDMTESVEARKVIETANRLKDEFLATLSHELRNPLNSIIGYSEILLRSPEVKKLPLVQKAAESIYSNARSQTQLINDLLDLSRLQTGKLAIDRQVISLAAFVGDAVETVRAYAIEKQIKLDVDLPAESIRVDVDPVRIQQIVWNLVNNAVKFTPEGGRVTITLSREQNEASIVVDDSGKGIEPWFLPHLFEMFRQSDSGTTRAYRGLGIGLALVKQLVELHSGQVSASSAGPGLGTRFTVRFPLYEGGQAEAMGPVREAVAEGQLTGTRILVVDDSRDSLDVLAYLLNGEGAIVETAANGSEALRLVNSCDRFDLVISDIAMPEMDGFELLQNLRADKRYRDVPMIALTGFGREEDLHRAQQAGFTTHLTKPLDFDHLIRVARLALGR